MIGRSIGVVTDGAAGHLSADLVNPLFAFSLNRRLRNFYNGEYFRFRDKSGEADYPLVTPDMSEDVFLVKIYDQKEKFGYDKIDMVQPEPARQPKLLHKDGLYRAEFSGVEYMTVDQVENIGDNFNILLIAKADYPRPAFGIWGDDTSLTIEPSSEATAKFTVNRNRGGMTTDSSVYGCFYGFDPLQNNSRVMSINTKGHNVEDIHLGNPEHIAIGRSGQRYYIGEVLEVVMHLDDLKQKWGDLLYNQAVEIYKDY